MSEIHETPLSYRLIDEIIRDWLNRKTALAIAAQESPARRDVIDQIRHLWLDGFGYEVTPEIVKAMRRAGQLRIEAGT